MVEFVSYDGEFPNLCRGDLVVRIDGKDVNLGCCLCSGGSVNYYEDLDGSGSYISDCGEWSVELPEEYEKYEEEITKLVNDNVPQGCCGGCA